MLRVARECMCVSVVYSVAEFQGGWTEGEGQPMHRERATLPNTQNTHTHTHAHAMPYLLVMCVCVCVCVFEREFQPSHQQR